MLLGGIENFRFGIAGSQHRGLQKIQRQQLQPARQKSVMEIVLRDNFCENVFYKQDS
jgi:hypothetical protein